MKKLMILFLACFMMACDDSFLSRNPLVTLSPDNFFNNQEECKLLVTGLYKTMTYQDYLFLDEYTDDVFSNAVLGGSGQNFIQGNIQTFDDYSKKRWTKNYQAIGNANLAVNGIGASSIAESVKLQLCSEARFFRAYYYFDLIALYGDVPLILTNPSASENLTPQRTPVDKVLEQVLTDLDFAAQNLPASYTAKDLGRVTKNAALAFKARVLVFFAKYADAAIAAKQCIDLGNHSLFPDLRGLFTEANEYNKEIVFDVGYLKDIQPSQRNMNIITQDIFLPTLSLANEFEMTNGKKIADAGSNFDPLDPAKGRDPRFWATILFPGTEKDGIIDTNGNPFIFIPANDLSVTGMRLRKSADYSDRTNNNSGTNFIILRYADVLLMYAESTNEIAGPTSAVYDAINQVRKRAGMPDLSENLSKEEMREKIRHERRVELAGEGLRYYDVVRWKIADSIFKKNIEGYDKQKLIDPKNPDKWIFEPSNVLKANWNAKKGYLWPIPGEEILLNPKLSQNPGY